MTTLSQFDVLDAADRARVEDVAAQLRGIERLGVAFSGGVDSAALLAMAANALGAEKVVALLGVSASLASREHEIAVGIAQKLGVELVEVRTRELEVEAYRRNDGTRCFHCKNTLFRTINDEVVEQHGITAVAYGENADDSIATDRPGQQAATKHHVLRPLSAAGIDKAAVRRIAAAHGLSVANKPAAPCLASRIAPFIEVTEVKLRQVEAVEAAIFELGFTDVRVRHTGDTARIELPAEEISLAAQDAIRVQIVDAAHKAGFRNVTLSMEGLRSGSMSADLMNSHHVA